MAISLDAMTSHNVLESFLSSKAVSSRLKVYESTLLMIAPS